MDNQEIKILLQRYINDECSEEEIVMVESWYINYEEKNLPELNQSQLDEIDHSCPPIEKKSNVIKIISLYRIAAAVLIVAFSTGVYFYIDRNRQHDLITHNEVQDIAPGTNKATLVLGNGKKINLSNNQTSQHLTNENKTSIDKTGKGQINYNPLGNTNKNLVFNTLITPKGGTFTVILEDGTKVILNAASKLTYPAYFVGNERKVELVGEAYFEVAHNRFKPFKVISSSQTVMVLGTHFNINAYPDENGIVTTLLEGSINVSDNRVSKLIKPGEQSSSKEGRINVDAANTDDAVAWKNGYFRFDNDNIQSIMKKLSRWYDIEVNYAGPITTTGFYGKISRFRNISEVLNLMEKTNGVHFKIDGRRITVMK